MSYITGNSNLNSGKNKFDSLTEIIKGFNIFLLSESKLDPSFPKYQLYIYITNITNMVLA